VENTRAVQIRSWGIGAVIALQACVCFCLWAQDNPAPADQGNRGGQAKDQTIGNYQPILDIKHSPGQDALYSIELRDIDLSDFFRVIARDYSLNIVLEKDVKEKVSASFTNISLEDAVSKIAEIYNLAVEQKGKVTFIRPNIVTRKFILKNITTDDLLRMPTRPGAAAPAAAGSEPQAQSSGQPGRSGTIYDLLSERGRILTGSQPNAVIVMDYPPNVDRVEEFIQLMDQRLAMKVFKLHYLSVKDLFPDLQEGERTLRSGDRKERQEERKEIKELGDVGKAK